MDEGETLLGLSSVYLFGRQLSDLILKAKYENGLPATGKNRFLRRQLMAGDARLARIFAFSFEGAFVELVRPAIFLVHGPGMNPDDPPPTNVEGEVEFSRLSRSPGSSARTGLGWQTGAVAKDMRAWAYGKDDISMRLDIETGPLEQILLSAELDEDGNARSSGSRSSGSRSSGSRSSGSRSSGVMSRSSGWMPRKSDGSD